jgi:drug/metabolite transporter (DMT)-like permease
MMHNGVPSALLAALLFGASTPLASLLAGRIAPVTLAGILYAGSGCGLAVWFFLRATLAARRARRTAAQPQARATAQDRPTRLCRSDLPWLAGAIAAGGVAGPVLLMMGLTHTPAASASLLLNMEGVFTALLAWCVFRENVDRQIFFGMLCIIAAGVLLAWAPQAAGSGVAGSAAGSAAGSTPGAATGTLLILGACLCWAIDNNLTRKISASDPVQIACIKGLVAGVVNLSIAAALGLPMPPLLPVLAAAAVGFCGYGLSLVLFVMALRQLGTARTGAYFSVAPFAGAAMSILLFGILPAPLFWLAAALMGVGLWLHLREHHAHLHVHAPLHHAHAHTHDAHHQHAHGPDWDGSSPHSHPHQHALLSHSHAHYPDIHHRHPH